MTDEIPDSLSFFGMRNQGQMTTLDLSREKLKIAKGFIVEWNTQTLLSTAVLVVLLFLVVYPLILIVVGSFQTSRPGDDTSYGVAAWVTAFDSPTVVQAIVNTVQLTWWRQVISLPLALFFAWLIAGTDLPGRNSLEFMFWIAFFLPALTVVQGYILMFDPQYGLVNQMLARLPYFAPGTFDIFSFWGIVFAHLATNTIAIKVMLLTPAFRNMDSSFEEAAEVAGSSKLGTFMRITVPMMAPAVLVVLLISTIRALETFEIEMVLGSPKNIYVHSMQIYYFIHNEPPEFGSATALSVTILLLMIPLVVGEQLATRKCYATIGGRYRRDLVRLGYWRWPCFAVVCAVLVFTTVIPMFLVLMGTFMKLWGFFNLSDPWTLQHWQTVLADRLFLQSLTNTLVIATGTGLVGAIWSFMVAYVVARTRFKWRFLIDFLSWLPFTLPGVILGLVYLRLLLGIAILQPLYGSLVVLVVVLTVGAMTTKVQILRSNLLQIGDELEEASRVAGSSFLYCLRTIVFPLVARAMLVSFILGFAMAAKNVSHVALLASSSNRPLSMLQLDYLVEGRYEPAAVVGVILASLTFGVALLITIAGRRMGTAQE